MTVKLASQNTKLRNGSNHRFERIRIVDKIMPQEIRLVFQKRNEPANSDAACGEPKKLMPCGMRYPEPFRARPNFFIPILAVCSYVVPFFMLLFFAFHSRSLPGTFELLRYCETKGIRIVFHSRFETSVAMLAVLALPMVAGASIAYMLSKKTKLNLKHKILAWSLIMSALVIAEIYFGCVLMPY